MPVHKNDLIKELEQIYDDRERQWIPKIQNGTLHKSYYLRRQTRLKLAIIELKAQKKKQKKTPTQKSLF